jgi:hypothetical protein
MSAFLAVQQLMHPFPWQSVKVLEGVWCDMVSTFMCWMLHTAGIPNN